MKPIVHRSLSLVWAFACASTLGLLASCGGSNDAAVAVAPAQAGSAEIGPAGGSVTATFAGGATVTLVVPPHALATPTTIRIDPGVAPADALAAMTVSPAGLQFAVPATLSVVLPAGSDPSNTLVAFGIDDVRVPIGFVDATTRTMSVDLRYLGDGSQPSAAPAIGAAGGRAMIAAAGQHPDGSVVVASLQLFVMEGDLTSALVLWHALVGALASDGSRNNAIRVQEGFDALLDLPLDHAPQAVQSQIAADVITWRNVDCTQLSAARSALASFSFASDFNGYADRALDVLAFGKFTGEMFDLAQQVKFVAPDACAALEADTAKPVRDSFQAYLDAAGAALNALSPVDDFDTLLNTRLGQLLNFTARLQEDGGVDDLAAKVQKLAADQTVRLRAGAYTDCRINHSQLKQRNLLVKELGEAAFEPLSPYDLVDLISDIEYCGILIHWQLLDASGAVLQRGDAGGVLPGTIVKAPTLTLTGADKLVLSGPLSALRCASAANDEQLAFTAGPAAGTGSSVGTLTPGNDSGYLEVSDLTLPVSRLKSLAQPAGGTDNGLLVIQRTGGLCNGDFPHFIQHSVLVGFTLDFGGVQITTTSLPDATAGLTYTAALKSAGGGSTLTWSATGLPAGLDIDPQTGVISGRPVAAGTASVAVTVSGADGSHATRTFSLVVKTSATLPPGTYALNLHIDCPSFLGGRIQSVFSGSVVLAPAGGQVTAMFSGLRDGGACLANTQVNGLLSASITTDASGTLALTSVSITPTIDASATAHGICPDVTVQVAGPVSEGPGHLQFNGDAPPLASQCFNFNYTGFDVNFVSQ